MSNLRTDQTIIAKVGECFNGDLDSARKLIDVAVDSGCDYVKFQVIDVDGLDNNDPERAWSSSVIDALSIIPLILTNPTSGCNRSPNSRAPPWTASD